MNRNEQKTKIFSLFIAFLVGYFTLKFLFTTEKIFFSRMTVLLGGSSVKKLTELYDLTKLLCF